MPSPSPSVLLFVFIIQTYFEFSYLSSYYLLSLQRNVSSLLLVMVLHKWDLFHDTLPFSSNFLKG